MRKLQKFLTLLLVLTPFQEIPFHALNARILDIAAAIQRTEVSPTRSGLAASRRPDYFDIRDFGAVADNVTGVASVTKGSTAITLSDAYPFTNGEGINILGAGPKPTLPPPPPPTVTTGATADWDIPNASLFSAKGADNDCYLLVYLDRLGGIGLPGPATCIATGLPLGIQMAPVTSAFASGGSNGFLAVLTFDRTLNVPVNAMVSYNGSNNAPQFTGKGIVISKTSKALTIEWSNYCEGSCSATGGALTWSNGNQVTFPLPASTNVWESAICGKRAADSAYHVYGMTHPILANYKASGYVDYEYGVDPAQNTWTDYGATQTNPTPYTLPVGDAICTAASVTSEFLSTTILSGAGTTVLTVANPASQTASGVSIRSDAGPNWQAADNAAFSLSPNMRGTVYVPDTGGTNRQRFLVHSPVVLNAYQNIIGNIQTTAPITFKGDMRGISNRSSLPQFAWDGYSGISGLNTYPTVIWDSDASGPERISFANPAQGLGVLFARTQYISPYNSVFISGGGAADASDYCGIALVFAPAPFHVDFVGNNAILSGPNQSSNSSWCPAGYAMNEPSGGTSISRISGNMSIQSRGFLFDGTGWPLSLEQFGTIYGQGCVMPPINITNVANPGYTKFALTTCDTSVEPNYSVINRQGPGGSGSLVIFGCATTSQESGGIPPCFQGTVQAVPSININPSPGSATPPQIFAPNTTVITARGVVGAGTTLLASGAPPTLSGTGACATITDQIGGKWSGNFACTSKTGPSTVVITPGFTAPNGWNCSASDQTANTAMPQSANSTTSCTIKGTVKTNDILTFTATAY